MAEADGGDFHFGATEYADHSRRERKTEFDVLSAVDVGNCIHLVVKHNVSSVLREPKVRCVLQ